MAATNIATNIALRLARSQMLRKVEHRAQLLARGDVELLVGVMQVRLDRPHGHEQRLRDLERGDYPFAWSGDGRSLYAFRHGEVPCTVYRLELATRRKEVWKVLAPADLTGVPNIGRVQITPDARAYAYGHVRQLSELFLVQGLK